jgi:hypothetical protein
MTTKTLGEIINEVRDGGRPDYEDLRYAICAMEALSVFNLRALERLALAQTEGKKPFLVFSATYQHKEGIRREQTARQTPPRQYVGWNNDPENPGFRARRAQSIALMKKLSKP